MSFEGVGTLCAGRTSSGGEVNPAYPISASVGFIGTPHAREHVALATGRTSNIDAAPIRRELVGYLSAEGMSTRAIAPAVNKDQSTVVRDKQVMQLASPEPAAPVERTVIAETRHIEIHRVCKLHTLLHAYTGTSRPGS